MIASSPFNIIYNVPQATYLKFRKKITCLEWSRGTGKSTILGKHIRDCVIQMPRSCGVLVGSSYAQIEERTLPSTKSGLAMHGWIEGVHYICKSRPPKSYNWEKPYEDSLDYKHAIIFYNGTILKFVSQDGAASSGRGMNVDWIVADEAALLDEKKFQTDVTATNRGNDERIAAYPDGSWKRFKECELHHSILLASTTPLDIAGRWFLKYEELAKKEPETYCFISADARYNIDNIGLQYFKDQKATMHPVLYNAEMLNIRVSKVYDSFYPMLKESIHSYTAQYAYPEGYGTDPSIKLSSIMDRDVDADSPLIIGADWGSSINCIAIAQKAGNDRINVVNGMYVLTPNILDDLAHDFIEYYKHHRNKKVHFFYDPSGNVQVANSRQTYAQSFANILRAAGWSVQMMTTALSNIAHDDKFNLWNNILKEDDPKYPTIRFNRTNGDALWVSMTSAPAKIGRNDTVQKDKKDEKNKNLDQQHTTHFSDAVDTIVVGLFINRLHKASKSTTPLSAGII